MRRGLPLALLGMVVLGAVLVTTGGAEVSTVRRDAHQREPQPTAPVPPSPRLADDGIELPDGSVQATPAGDGAPAPEPLTNGPVEIHGRVTDTLDHNRL